MYKEVRTTILLAALLMGSCDGKFFDPNYQGQSIHALKAELEVQVNQNWQALKNPQDLPEPQAKIKIMKSFKKFKKTLQQFEINSDFHNAEIQLNNSKIQGIDQGWLRYFGKVRSFTDSVALLYTEFENMTDNPGSIINDELLLNKLVISDVNSGSVDKLLANFHDLVMKNQPALFSYMNHILTNQEEYLCLSMSNHQVVYTMFNAIALTEIKGYTVIQFAYMILTIIKKENFSTKAKAAIKSYEAKAKEKIQGVKQILPSMSRVLRRCDPEAYREGDTFEMVKGFLQGYMVNEDHMNRERTCAETCSDWSFMDAEIYGCKDKFCKKTAWQQCKGRIYGCEYASSSSEVCVAPQPSDRRYNWIKYYNGTLLGNKSRGQCEKNIPPAVSWGRLFVSCDYCFCKCEKEESKLGRSRYWSKLPSVADVESGYIMTGARFVKRKGIFYLQIQQAKPLPAGGVDKSSRLWVEPDTVPEDAVATNNRKQLTHLSWFERNMDLDHLSAPGGHVLTGIKLRRLHNNINLEIQTTPIKFKTGELLSNQSIWIGNDEQVSTGRKFFPIPEPDIPTMAPKGKHNKVDSGHNQYFTFDTTAPSKDAAQTMIPFIDIQPVAMSSWLSGAGLYHKGQKGFGGFVGLQMETYKYTPNL